MCEFSILSVCIEKYRALKIHSPFSVIVESIIPQDEIAKPISRW